MVFACYAYPKPVFQPAMRIVTAITNSFPAQVTTSFNHNFITGTVVRFYVPLDVGMQQIQGLTGAIFVTGLTTFNVDIDTTLFDTFTIPSPAPATYTCAQVIPIGEVNSILTAAVQNVLPYSG